MEMSSKTTTGLHHFYRVFFHQGHEQFLSELCSLLDVLFHGSIPQNPWCKNTKVIRQSAKIPSNNRNMLFVSLVEENFILMTLVLQANSDFEWKVYLPPFLWFIIVLAGLWLYQWHGWDGGSWGSMGWEKKSYGNRCGEMEPHRLLCQWKFNQDSSWGWTGLL